MHTKSSNLTCYVILKPVTGYKTGKPTFKRASQIYNIHHWTIISSCGYWFHCWHYTLLNDCQKQSRFSHAFWSYIPWNCWSPSWYIIIQVLKLVHVNLLCSTHFRKEQVRYKFKWHRDAPDQALNTKWESHVYIPFAPVLESSSRVSSEISSRSVRPLFLFHPPH